VAKHTPEEVGAYQGVAAYLVAAASQVAAAQGVGTYHGVAGACLLVDHHTLVGVASLAGSGSLGEAGPCLVVAGSPILVVVVLLVDPCQVLKGVGACQGGSTWQGVHLT